MACESGGKGIVSAIFCISFIFGVNFVMLNLVIAVIIDQFVESAGREGLFLDNTLFEILHKKMLLDRFLKRLRTKVGIRLHLLYSAALLMHRGDGVRWEQVGLRGSKESEHQGMDSPVSFQRCLAHVQRRWLRYRKVGFGVSEETEDQGKSIQRHLPETWRGRGLKGPLCFESQQSRWWLVHRETYL